MSGEMRVPRSAMGARNSGREAGAKVGRDQLAILHPRGTGRHQAERQQTVELPGGDDRDAQGRGRNHGLAADVTHGAREQAPSAASLPSPSRPRGVV